MTCWENYHDVVAQMEQFGVQFKDRDMPLAIDHPKRKGCGKGGKWWYWLRTFQVRGHAYIVGVFGSYKTGDSLKVDWRAPELNAEDRARFAQERAQAEAAAIEARRRESEFAAGNARLQWSRGREAGSSPYLDRKGVQPECCRYMPDGSILIPLIRYDMPRETALRAVQRIYPGPRSDSRTGEELPQKTFTKGFDPTGCALRLGRVEHEGDLVMICEGYATGLTVRMATNHRFAMFVGLSAGNLLSVAEIVRNLHPLSPILVCADDDWKTRDHAGNLHNVGRKAAIECTKRLHDTHMTYPVWSGPRGDKATDFNDLQASAGLDEVRKQLRTPIQWLQPDPRQ